MCCGGLLLRSEAFDTLDACSFTAQKSRGLATGEPGPGASHAQRLADLHAGLCGLRASRLSPEALI